jgi:cell division septation protein DedD
MSADAVIQEQTDVTGALYRAAMGAPNQAYYLRHFARFDAAGKTGISWNWAVFASPLNWLIFRKMWGLARWYALVLGLLVAALLGIGRFGWRYSSATAWALLLFVLLASSVIAAIYANAAYYRFCEKRITRALVANLGVHRACEMLAGQASSARRGWALAGLNLLGCCLLLIAAANSTGAQQLRRPSLSFAGPIPEAASRTLRVTDPLKSIPPVLAMATSAPVPAASAEPAASVAPTASAEPATSAVPATQAAVLAEAPPQSEPARPGPRYYVQVGAYAKKDNARKVMLRLQTTDLEAHRQLVSTKRGALIQVRVGPLASRSDALAAADQIKALDLPALLVKH